MKFEFLKKDNIKILFICIFILLSGIWYKIYIDNSYYAIKVDKPKASVSNINPSYEKNVYVEISGNVLKAGVYSINNAGNLGELIYKAGGLTENGNTTVINLSKKITDEMVIIIYSNQEVADFKTTKQVEEQVIEKCIQKDQESLKNDACIPKEFIEQSSSEDTKVSLNEATLEQLMTLSGIGESKAQAIISYREQHGEFEEIEELMQVSGIGESVFEQIKDHITL